MAVSPTDSQYRVNKVNKVRIVILRIYWTNRSIKTSSVVLKILLLLMYLLRKQKSKSSYTNMPRERRNRSIINRKGNLRWATYLICRTIKYRVLYWEMKRGCMGKTMRWIHLEQLLWMEIKELLNHVRVLLPWRTLINQLHKSIETMSPLLWYLTIKLHQ